MTDSRPVDRYRTNLQGEFDSAGLYHALAEAEPDAHLREVYRRLAAVEEAHAEFWREQLAKTGTRAGPLQLGWRTRALAWLARRFGPQFVLPTLSSLEQRDSSAIRRATGGRSRRPALGGALPQPHRAANRRVDSRRPARPHAGRGSKGATAEAAMRCGPRCWEPTTDWFRT